MCLHVCVHVCGVCACMRVLCTCAFVLSRASVALTTGRRHEVNSINDDAISLVSHATEERLKNILSKLAVISQHRTEILKVSNCKTLINDLNNLQTGNY